MRVNSPFSFEGQLCTFSRVLSLLGRYFYNMANMFEIVCFLMLKTLINVDVYIILDFPITYRNDSVLCQSECACLHQTINMVVFFIKFNGTTYPKGRALMQMYRVVPITKRGNYQKHRDEAVNTYIFLLSDKRSDMRDS